MAKTQAMETLDLDSGWFLGPFLTQDAAERAILDVATTCGVRSYSTVKLDGEGARLEGWYVTRPMKLQRESE